ncbi:TonB-dependent siderophore receptor [Dyella silvatica]|uniref:TonB-dependent siderophore receptor n=1 Tax=Dyella silvatica TaxID=2992128 RepID=UPI003CCCF637
MTRQAHSPFVLTALLCAVAATHAQDASNTTTANTPPAASVALAPVMVKARSGDGYVVSQSQVNNFGQASLQDTPASINVLSRDLLDDRQPRGLSELARSDASLGDSYAPVGYYQNIAIRGFPLDLATGYRFNDLSITGEQRIAFENIQQVDILKGAAGIDAGVLAPGGVINYVGKRAANVQTTTLGTDSHGSRYGALDLGRWLSPTFGLRFNTAYEDTHAYVQHANGRRNFYAIAADWLISPKATLQLDADYQASAQRSVSGYQLLGGSVLPTHPSRSLMLGYQPWQQPVSIHASNITARFHYQFNDDWQARVDAGHSRSVIDDNVAFAYGCFYAPACASGSTPGYFFAPDGSYDVYDFRSPDDTRQNDELRAQLQGHLDTGTISHDLTVGADVLRRSINQRPYVYDYVGTAPSDQGEPPYFAPSPNQPGPSQQRQSTWQRALFAMDRVRLSPHWQVLAGGRFVQLDERDYDASGAPQRHIRLNHWLPQTALLWQPTSQLTGYLSYAQGLALGTQAPYWTANGGSFLPPLLSRQWETGLKYAVNDALQLDAAVFRIALPYQYAQPDNTSQGFTFVQRGQQVNSGIELQANGRVSDSLHVIASISMINARAQNTGTPSYEGHQVVNVPKLRSSVYADYRLPFATSWSLLGGWRYAAPNAATPSGRTRVPAYNLFDAGLRYRTRLNGHELSLRLSIDNVFNRFYWRDTGSSGGDSYLFPGAPRLARVSMSYEL